MSDFTVVRPFIYVEDTLIDQGQANPNENDIYGSHNAAFNATSGHMHTGTTGDGPKLGASSIDLTANYPWTGNHSWTQTIKVFDGSSLNLYSDNGTTLTASISGSNGTSSFQGAMNLNSHQLNGLSMAGSPAGTDAVNVDYLNSEIASNSVQSVSAGTNISISGTSNNPIVSVSVAIVSAVTASGNIASSGGSTPNITFTGILPVTNGGSGGASHSAHGVLIGAGTSPFNVTGAGTPGQILTSNGGSLDPTFQDNATNQLNTFGTFSFGSGTGTQSTGAIKFYSFSGNFGSGNLIVNLGTGLAIIGVKLLHGPNSNVLDYKDEFAVTSYQYDTSTGIFSISWTAGSDGYTVFITALA